MSNQAHMYVKDIQDKMNPSEAAKIKPSPAEPVSGDRFIYKQRLFVEATYADGRPFFDGEVHLTTYDQRRLGVVGLNHCIVDWLRAQTELGQASAEMHGEVMPERWPWPKG